MSVNFTKLREKMVKTQIIRRGIKDGKIIEAFKNVAREEFVDSKYKDDAYNDSPLPIDKGQTISQPYIVAYMIEKLNLSEEDKVLEIGTGSGYAAAILAQIVEEVYTIERFEILAEKASQRFKKLGYNNIKVKVGDGTLGWGEYAPYDGIVVSAAAPHVPEELKEQLAENGKIIIPVGEKTGVQQLKLITKSKENTFKEENLDYVRFVPLTGENGWS
ncbi:protein-L-isoaspartate(D-aspartate) O-methyltransferase [Halanaerobium hydrogeniformans]|uniref:Protein-L-isoaspartate O-methyltransferase n=1 Tax=Halanaerobium hydrogeniformans TaxID=656519 RepID=E4RIS8_HALHG|nr:protein-L-isoaspartate(D-aspartate) O-methyltransferase [Halanaerobium hydrogeniformans]ADQ15148.1 protein-L-isoaspartate O-methyltransferase [Halanaerobium hydrogeniformans]